MSRQRLRDFIENPKTQHAVIGVIAFNGIVLGLETSTGLMDRAGTLLNVLDTAALVFFVIEMLVKLYAYGPRFFRDPWNVFDFAVIAIALVPFAGGLSVLRALRILRVLRITSAAPNMRRVVAALLNAVPGIASILGLIALILYVAAVMATMMFRDVAPEYFGDFGKTLWSLFTVMTGENWPTIADAVLKTQPYAWIFFLLYLLVTTFVVLNLFIAVVVNAMEAGTRAEAEEERRLELSIATELQTLRAEQQRRHQQILELLDAHTNGHRHRPDHETLDK